MIGRKLRLGQLVLVSLAPDGSQIPTGKSIPAIALVGTAILLLIQRRVCPRPWHQTSVGSWASHPRSVARNLGRLEAAHRNAVSGRARDLDGRHPTGTQPTGICRGNSLHNRL